MSDLRSMVETCALDFLVQPGRANRAATTKAKKRDRPVHLSWKVMNNAKFEAAFYFPTTRTSNWPFSAVERKSRRVLGSSARVLARGRTHSSILSQGSIHLRRYFHEMCIARELSVACSEAAGLCQAKKENGGLER